MTTVYHLVPAMQSGGVEQVVLELCAGLQARGVHNTVISAGGDMVKDIEATGAMHIARRIDRKHPATLREVCWLRAHLLQTQPDILHVHSRIPAWIVRLCCALLPKEKRPRIVSSFHGFHSVNAYSGVMTKGDRVIAVSCCMREHILTHYPSTPESRITVIPNSIDPRQHHAGFTPSSEWLEQWRAEHPELEGRMVLCLPGRITRLKGAEHLTPLLTKLHELGVPAHVLIIGECKQGKEAYKQELIEQFATAGLTSHISWLGHRRDLRELFCISDVVLSLTLKPESFGKTTLEALALGRPVMGYEHGGVGELLDDFLPAGKIPLNDIDSMAARLSQWHQQAPQVLHSASAPYRREDMLDAHLDLYRSLAPS